MFMVYYFGLTVSNVPFPAEAFYGRMRMTEGPWMRKRIARTKAFKLNQEARLDPVPAPAPVSLTFLSHQLHNFVYIYFFK